MQVGRRLRSVKVWLVVTVLVAAGMAAGPAEAVRGDTILVSISGAFGPKGNSHSGGPSISADGRSIAFDSQASNLHPDDTELLADIFVRDLASNTITLVSRAGGAGGANSNGTSLAPDISADGRFVAFQSQASNLHPSDIDTTWDIFVRDLVSDTITLVSRHTSGVKGNAHSLQPSISADGRFVAFESFASNLHDDDTDSVRDVFVRDLASNTTTLVSRASDVSVPKGNAPSAKASISADGASVAFQSSASNLHDDDMDAVTDVFIRDLASGAVTLVSRHTSGAKGTGDSGVFGVDISADGRFVTFDSNAPNLHDDDAEPDLNVFVRDVKAQRTTLVSRATGASGTKAFGGSPTISAEGRFVTFDSSDATLDPTDAFLDVYVRDLTTNSTTLVSRAAGTTGAKGNESSHLPVISADGRFVSFQSWATNLDPNDTDPAVDVYVRDVLGPQPPPSLLVADRARREGRRGITTFRFRVTLEGVPGRTVTVDYATKDGTATVSDKDYRFSNGTLTFGPGQTSKTIVVDVRGDGKKERHERFRVRLFNARGAEIEKLIGIGTIRNDD